MLFMRIELGSRDQEIGIRLLDEVRDELMSFKNIKIEF